MNNLKVSEYLTAVIEDCTHDDVAELWIDITNKKIICHNSESRLYHIFNEDTLLYEIINCTDLAEIVKKELKLYFMEVSKYNTDKRIALVRKRILSGDFAITVVKTIGPKILDKTFVYKLDVVKHVINFNNGYINLKTGVFYKRTHKHFFSKCLNYDYNKTVDEIIVNKLKKMIKQICNDDEEFMEFMFAWLGYCLTGETKEQKSFWYIGHSASNGKSTLSKIFKECFNEYCYKMDSNALTKGFSKMHKQLSECTGKRFVYIEELPQENLNVAMYKDLVDGDMVNNEVLFKTVQDIEIQFKLNIISNYDPKFNADKGMCRRGLLAEFKNRFLDEDDYNGEVNKKGVYLNNTDLSDKFKTDKYKLAFIHILIPYATKYYESRLKIPATFKSQFKEICKENDKMADFIDNYFTRTGNLADRIYKEEFVSFYNSHYNSKIQWIALLSDLKRCNIEFKSDLRTIVDGKSQKGVIIGLKSRDEEKEIIYPFKGNIDPVQPVVIKTVQPVEEVIQSGNYNLKIAPVNILQNTLKINERIVESDDESDDESDNESDNCYKDGESDSD